MGYRRSPPWLAPCSHFSRWASAQPRLITLAGRVRLADLGLGCPTPCSARCSELSDDRYRPHDREDTPWTPASSDKRPGWRLKGRHRNPRLVRSGELMALRYRWFDSNGFESRRKRELSSSNGRTLQREAAHLARNACNHWMHRRCYRRFDSGHPDRGLKWFGYR